MDHSSIRRVDGLSISSSLSCIKLLLDFSRFFGTVWTCSGCLVLFTCSSPPPSLSMCAATRFLIAGGVIPAIRLPLSILLGRRHHVKERQTLFNIGLTLYACADLPHTGHAYFAVE